MVSYHVFLIIVAVVGLLLVLPTMLIENEKTRINYCCIMGAVAFVGAAVLLDCGKYNKFYFTQVIFACGAVIMLLSMLLYNIIYKKR